MSRSASTNCVSFTDEDETVFVYLPIGWVSSRRGFGQFVEISGYCRDFKLENLLVSEELMEW